MNLVDLKRTDADKKKEREAYDKPLVSGMDDYPYGLNIHLDNAAIEKLGLSDEDFDPADAVGIVGTGIIVSENINTVGGKRMRSMTIQLQKLSVSKEATKVSVTKTLYGED